MNEAFGKVMIEEKAMQHYSPAQFAPLDRQEFQSLYRENLGPIYRYVYSKVRNREEAEDLTSHIFIKAVRHIDHAYELFEFSSSADHVQHLLQALSERDREVLTCRFLLGLSLRETAVRMGLTEGNVKISQFRALKRAADLEYVVS